MFTSLIAWLARADLKVLVSVYGGLMTVAVSKVRGIIYAFIASLCWSIGTIFVKFLQNYYSVTTQNAYRFLAAGLLLMLIYLYVEKSLSVNFWGATKKALVLAVIVNIFQTVLIMGIYLTKASTAGFISRLSVIFVGLMGYVFYEEERRLVRNPKYLVGLTLALVGVAGFTLRLNGRQVFDLGALIILFSCIIWAFYIIVLKKFSGDVNPLLLTSLIFVIGGLFLLPFSLLKGGFIQIVNAPTLVTFILILSGLISIGLPNWSNLLAINSVGAIVASTMQLIQPFLTFIFAISLLGEAVSPMELLSGLLILAGNGLVVYALYES